MTAYENYLDKAIDDLKAGSGDLFSEAVHDAHDHTGVPGVGGGGGAYITAGAVCALSNIEVGSESSATGPLNGQTNSADVTFTGDTVNILTDGVYTVTLFTNWAAAAGETATRNSGWQFTNSDGTFAFVSSYAFNANASSVTVTGEGDYKNHLSATGFIKAGSSFTFLFENLDPAHASTLSFGQITVVRLS